MTPQEKEAKRIFDLFKIEGNYLQGREEQKKQALICVREIIKTNPTSFEVKPASLEIGLDGSILGVNKTELLYKEVYLIDFYTEVEQILKENY